VLDRVPPLVQLAGRGDVGGVQAALGDLEEPPGAQVKGLGRQGLEPLRELAVEQRCPVVRGSLDLRGSLIKNTQPTRQQLN
jgi:hypothetical protein